MNNQKTKLRTLLDRRKDKRFREGVIEGALCAGVIDGREFYSLLHEYIGKLPNYEVRP